MSVQVSYKKQFVLGIFFILVIFAGIEGFSRIYLEFFLECDFMKEDNYSELDIHRKKQICNDHYNKIMYILPYRHHEPNQHFSSFNINNEGFRGPDISTVKQDNTYRIFLVGGSTAFGSGSTSDEATITGHLQQNFDDVTLSKKIEVINAGHDGMFSWDETESIKNKIVNYNPDLVIIYNGANDLQYSFDYIQRSVSEKSSLEIFSDKMRGGTSIFKSLIVGNLFSKSLQNSFKGVQEHKSFDEKYVSERILFWKEKIKENCELGKNFGFDTLIILQPIIDSEKKPLTEFEYQLFNYTKKFPGYYQLFAEEFKKLNMHCNNTVDLRNIFKETNESIFNDWVHVGDKGNMIIADRIFEISLPIVEKG